MQLNTQADGRRHADRGVVLESGDIRSHRGKPSTTTRRSARLAPANDPKPRSKVGPNGELWFAPQLTIWKVF